MDDFASQAGRPNAFGLVQGDANAIAPGKRMLSSMCPIIVIAPDASDNRGERVVLVAGAAGGPKIISAVFQVLSNVVDFGLDAQAAVAAPRVHHQHQPDRLLLERQGFDSATIASLQALGHRVGHESALADVIAIGRQGEAMAGAPDPRRAGVAGSTD
jgi:gamma-glutamyltranspeptidase/glutathione hydrolase